ncbi:MAG: sulfite exporter TauE/SafE family protein [Acutalibacteraceae bacterium]|nr:sulfite exporter TauE/SafE family protein [Acutalibacteraceae bacterium]
MKLIKNIFFGGITGFLNGLLGAGGGMVAVPVLKRDMETKEAHATCISIILPMSIASAVSYILKGAVEIKDVFPYLPGGIIGAFLGIYLLKKVKPKFIKKLFALVMLWAGVRMVFV